MFHTCRHLSVVARGLGRSTGGSCRCAALTLDLPFQAGRISSCGGSCECYSLSPIAVVCRWPLLLPSLLLSAQPAVAADLAASPALIPAVRCSTRLSGLREHLQRGNARDRTYSARHERTTQPLQHHRHCRVRWRLPSRPSRVRCGSRPGRIGQVRDHQQRAPRRQDHQRGHGHRAPPVRSRGRRQGRRIRCSQASGPVIQSASRRPCPASCRARGLTGGNQAPVGWLFVVYAPAQELAHDQMATLLGGAGR